MVGLAREGGEGCVKSFEGWGVCAGRGSGAGRKSGWSTGGITVMLSAVTLYGVRCAVLY